jgi:hypothetical protein
MGRQRLQGFSLYVHIFSVIGSMGMKKVSDRASRLPQAMAGDGFLPSMERWPAVSLFIP